MSWRSDAQRADVARALLALVRLERLWTPDGPTDEALDLIEDGGGPLSGGQKLILLVAFDAWNNEGGAPLGEILGRLDNEKLAAVGELLAAVARDDVDGWLVKWRPAPVVRPVR